jgi:hypothetical protein
VPLKKKKEGTNPVNTLILDLQPEELCENKIPLVEPKINK